MKILINALSAKSGGGQTYLLNLLKQIPNDYPQHFIFLCGTFNANIFTKIAPDCVEFKIMGRLLKNSLIRSIWERLYLPYYLQKKKINLYFQPAAGVPILVPKRCQSATMLRNMLPFEDKERKRYPLFSLVRFKMYLLKHNIISSLEKADKVVFISHYSQKIVAKFIPDIVKKSIVIPHGLNEQFLYSKYEFDIKKLGIESRHFYLYVSPLEYYKAQLEIVREWKILVEHGFQYPLVLAGPLSSKSYAEKVRAEIKCLNLERQVIITGGIVHNELPAFYRQARALIFASSCECCPNILLEKMAAGRPLFVSDIPPMPEFGGDYAYYFNPYRKGELARQILNAETNYDEMLIRGEKVHKEALKYNWKETITRTIQFITS